MRLPDLQAWAIFAKVAELGSFARAAEDLALSKATVSKAITRLEERLGAQLIHRTSRKLSLTETGQLSYERAARILSDAESLDGDIAMQLVAPRGKVKISVPMSFGVEHLTHILPDFLKAYPEVSVEAILDDGIVDLVGEGFDLALRISTMADTSLRARRLCAVRRPLVASTDYLKRRGIPQTPQELQDHDCLIYTNNPNPSLWRLTHHKKPEVSVRVSGRLMSNNADTINGALLAGLGIARQPEFAIWKHLQDGLLQEVLPEWSTPEISLNIVMPPGRLRPTRVSVLIDFLRTHFKAPPWGRTLPDVAEEDG